MCYEHTLAANLEVAVVGQSDYFFPTCLLGSPTPQQAEVDTGCEGNVCLHDLELGHSICDSVEYLLTYLLLKTLFYLCASLSIHLTAFLLQDFSISLPFNISLLSCRIEVVSSVVLMGNLLTLFDSSLITGFPLMSVIPAFHNTPVKIHSCLLEQRAPCFVQ